MLSAPPGVWGQGPAVGALIFIIRCLSVCLFPAKIFSLWAPAALSPFPPKGKRVQWFKVCALEPNWILTLPLPLGVARFRAGPVISLCLRFFISDMGIVTAPTRSVLVRVKDGLAQSLE